MSYDLLVFDPAAAPRDRTQFMRWWEAQSQWGEEHGYKDPRFCSSALQNWYRAITATFPNLNGPDVSDDDIGSRHTDYSLGSSVVYAAFAWTEAETAYPLVRELAVEHGVGFYDASGDEGDGEIYFRSGDVSKYVPENFPQNEPPKRRWFEFFRRNK